VPRRLHNVRGNYLRNPTSPFTPNPQRAIMYQWLHRAPQPGVPSAKPLSVFRPPTPLRASIRPRGFYATRASPTTTWPLPSPLLRPFPFPFPLNPPSHTPQQTLLPAETCIEALIVAGGNVHLAAERLFGVGSHGPAMLTASIAQDPLAIESLQTQLRTLTMLQAFDALHEARTLLPTVLSELEPKDFANYYLKLVDHMREFTTPDAGPATPQDALARLINMLPPAARRAFMTLVAPGSAHDAAPTAFDAPNAPAPSLGSTQGVGEPPELGSGVANSHEPEAITEAPLASPVSTTSGDVQPFHQLAEGEAA
jgi:hypothetical protein